MNYDEFWDLIAEAARTSPHAERAYELAREYYGLQPLKWRQAIIAGRMDYAKEPA